jgi:putative phage-type endonuclease
VSSYAPGSPEWLAERRVGITSTDIPAILGISPWRSEGDVAREKMGEDPEPPDAETARRFRLGIALEDVVATEEEVEHGIKLRHVRRLLVHPTIPWAMTSLDFERVGERTIVEVKTTTSRDWDDGLPEYVEAQVRWQMGVAGYPAAHVAALRFGSQLACFDLDHDPATFDNLVVIATDFRRRLDAGGPFAETRESARRAWPYDDGSEIVADAELAEAVDALVAVRADLAVLKQRDDDLVAAITTRMGPATAVLGAGWRVTWKRAKDSEVTEYKTLALDALGLLDPPTIADLMERHTSTRPGSRRFLVRLDREK